MSFFYVEDTAIRADAVCGIVLEKGYIIVYQGPDMAFRFSKIKYEKQHLELVVQACIDAEYNRIDEEEIEEEEPQPKGKKK